MVREQQPGESNRKPISPQDLAREGFSSQQIRNLQKTSRKLTPWEQQRARFEQYLIEMGDRGKDDMAPDTSDKK